MSLRCYKFSSLFEVECPLVQFSLSAILDPRVGHTTVVLSPLISVVCDSDWFFHGKFLFHVLMLFIQAIRALPLTRLPGTVPCIISLFSSDVVPCHAIPKSNNSRVVPTLFRTHCPFVFAVQETRGIHKCP